MITENAGTVDTVILRDVPLTVHLSLYFIYRGKVVTLKPVSRVSTRRAVLFLRGKFHYTLLIGLNPIILYWLDWIQRKHLGNLDRLLNALLTFSRKRPTVNISCKKAISAEEAKFPEKTIIVPASITLENEFTQAKELSTLITSTRWQYTLGNLQLCNTSAYLRRRDSWCFKQFFVHT